MKTTISILTLAVAAFLATTASAGQQVLLGSMYTISTVSTNSLAVPVSVAPTPNGTIYIQHGLLSTTNDFTITAQVSVVNTNSGSAVVSVATFHPTTIVATNELWQPTWTMPQLYLSGYVTNTTGGSLQLGATITQ